MNFIEISEYVFVNLDHIVGARLLEGQKADSSKQTKELVVRFMDGTELRYEGEPMLNLILALKSRSARES